jgi:hypothetical protein
MENRMRLLVLLAGGCLAATAGMGCMFEHGGTEVIEQGPATTRADTDAGTSSARPRDAGTTDGASGADAPLDAAAMDRPAALGAAGSSCSDPAACASGFCVDGVCCQSACTGTCQACNLDGQRGVCTPVKGAPEVGHGACLGTGSVCAGSCDGVSSACHYPGAELECAPASCSNAIASGRSICSGSGACLPGVMTSCAPFSCDGAICAGGCGPGRPCQAGDYCSGGRCFPAQANGATCSGAEECVSGACVDGHCCGSASCGVCAACVGPNGTCQKITSAPDPDTCAGNAACGPDGQCRKINGQVCDSADSCVSGFCVGGHCCDGACAGGCQSCALPGSVGTCRPTPLDADPNNCGRCGNSCSTNHITPTCVQGTCAGSCAPGFADCNGNLPADGCETALASDARNCGTCGNVCPGTNCIAGVCEKIQFSWSSAGPIPGKICVPISEPADPNGWNDNYLCTDRDFGLQWSFAGPVAGLACTQWLELGDPFGWTDNYLCAPVDYGLHWSSAGPLAGLRCTPITEPADPFGWGDNYLCAPP